MRRVLVDVVSDCWIHEAQNVWEHPDKVIGSFMVDKQIGQVMERRIFSISFRNIIPIFVLLQ